MLLAVAVTSILTWFIMANYLMWWQQLLHLNQLTKISTLIKHSCQRAKHGTFLHNKSINVTTVTEVWSASTCLFAGMWHPWWVLLQHYYVAIIFHRRVWYRVLSLRYLKFTHHSHPLGYLCAKFHFFRGLHCWATPWRKILYSITYSIAHSVTHPAYLRLWEPKRLCFGISE